MDISYLKIATTGIPRAQCDCMQLHDFGYALNMLRAGFSVARTHMQCAGYYLQLMEPCNDSDLSVSIIVKITTHGIIEPWAPSHTDLLTTFDWDIVDTTKHSLPVVRLAPCTGGIENTCSDSSV